MRHTALAGDRTWQQGKWQMRICEMKSWQFNFTWQVTKATLKEADTKFQNLTSLLFSLNLISSGFNSAFYFTHFIQKSWNVTHCLQRNHVKLTTQRCNLRGMSEGGDLKSGWIKSTWHTYCLFAWLTLWTSFHQVSGVSATCCYKWSETLNFWRLGVNNQNLIPPRKAKSRSTVVPVYLNLFQANSLLGFEIDTKRLNLSCNKSPAARIYIYMWDERFMFWRQNIDKGETSHSKLSRFSFHHNWMGSILFLVSDWLRVSPVQLWSRNWTGPVRREGTFVLRKPSVRRFRQRTRIGLL